MSSRKPTGSTPKKSPTIKVPVKEQVSAGGVVFRGEKGSVEVVIVSVGGQNRWQLPKGLVEAGENPEIAAVREAREEGGVSSEVVQLLETGHAYREGDSIYYRISSFPGYGKLSRLDTRELKVGARIDADEYEKEQPNDFVLVVVGCHMQCGRVAFVLPIHVCAVF